MRRTKLGRSSARAKGPAMPTAQARRTILNPIVEGLIRFLDS